jgi:hypothetical protein
MKRAFDFSGGKGTAASAICPAFSGRNGGAATRASAFLLAACLFAGGFPAAARAKSNKKADTRAQAQALFQKALAVSDIRAPGSPPFELQGTIDIHEGGGKDAHGTYDLKWAAPGKWREEIHFANYSRVRIGGHNEYWQLRSTDFELLPLYNFSQAFRFARTLESELSDPAWTKKDKFSFKLRNAGNQKTDCVSVKTPGYSESFCFDTRQGTLIGEDNNFTNYGFDAVEFGEFLPLEGKQFPGRMQLLNRKDLLVEFQASSISPLGNAPDSLFTSPAGSTLFADCPAHSAGAPKISRQIQPVYPPNDYQARTSGAVYIYAVVGIDGGLHNPKLIAAPSPTLAASALQAVSGWRYTPATCNGAPQPAETILSVLYSIGY